MSASLLLCGLLLTIGAIALYQRLRYPSSDGPLIDAIDALLPQTQCAQCGYPGCRPYAEALARGEAGVDLCPPGGAAVHSALAELTGDAEGTMPPVPTHLNTAFIEEADCIGCALCLPACPIDAIVGAQGQMHTVIAAHCTGCELCVPACPVDCITMSGYISRPDQTAQAGLPLRSGCISCGACDPVCPINLPVSQLWMLLDSDAPDAAEAQGLERCIECGLCDRACPSGLDLARTFGAAKAQLASDRAAQAARDTLKARHLAHQQRAQARAAAGQEQRRKRLARRRSWQ